MRSILSALAGLVAMTAPVITPAHAGASEPTAFDFAFQSIDGAAMPLSAFKGRVMLVVNTASFCGFTNQYAGLQNLHETYEASGLTVIGVPSNDFGGQEPNPEKDVKEFCQGAFGVTFPLTQKYQVRGAQKHPFYGFAQAKLGVFNAPAWNFHKYLVGRDGQLIAAYGATTAPQSPRLVDAIKLELAKPAPQMSPAP